MPSPANRWESSRVTPEHIMRLADLIGASVMQEPDEPDDEED